MGKVGENNEKPGLLGISTKIIKVVLCFLIGFNSCIFVYFGIINRGDVLEDEPIRFMESWAVKDNDGKSYITCSTLPMGIKDNEYIFIDIRKDIAVYIDGTLRKDFVEERDVNIPGGSVKKFYMMIPLGEADSGKEVRMVMSSVAKDDQAFSEAFISTRSGAISHLMRTEGLAFILAIIVLIFSFTVFVVSVVLRIWYKLKIDMLYGALGIFIIASWILTDSYLFPFLFGVYHINGVINYILCFMIPFAPVIYLNSLQHSRYKKTTSVIMIVSSVNALIWPFLHFAEILPFYKIRSIGNLILAAMTLTAIVVLIIDAKRKNVSEYRYTFIGFFGFLVCCAIELILILTGNVNATVPMVVGLGILLTFVVIQQIDDLRMINLEKQHAIDISEAKTRFLASMSHEIRTPINAILGMNEMILRENGDRVIGEYARNIKASGKMLLMLVNDVLDFSKIEAGKLEIHEAHFLMSEMLKDTIPLIKERADEKGLELVLELKSEIPDKMISDEFRLRQILVNLLGNAVKYTDKGSVTLMLLGEYTSDGYELSIQVKDTGKGIRKEEQDGLFEAFSRADIKANMNIEGTGLGLAIVKSIVDSMGGTTGFESEYGTGSLFWVKLPMKYFDTEPLRSILLEKGPEDKAYYEACEFTAQEANVLAVDDNRSNLTIVKLFLKRTGVGLDLCSSGDRAAELCREKKYDLILLDHMMPRPDGIETLHIIRNDEESLNRDTKVIVLTANAVAGSRQMYIDEGFDDYLTKPLDSKRLEQTVKNMLPKEKVNDIVRETEDVDEARFKNSSPFRRKLSDIDGLDYELALSHCGGDEGLLEEIISDITSECAERMLKLKEDIERKDLKAYRIDSHSVKGTLATIGMTNLSERARRHEFAARDNDTGFIFQDAEGFIAEYTELCGKLKEALL